MELIGRIREITGDYGSIAEIIDKRSTFLSSKDVSLGAASALSCSPTERSTEEETPIARAVSGSLCVCVRNLRSLLITEFVLGARHNSIRKGRRKPVEFDWENTGEYGRLREYRGDD